MKRMNRCSALLLTCSVFGFIPVTGLAAQSQSGSASAPEEILVTANKRGAENLQKVPSSISAISQQGLARSAAQGLQDYAKSLPGLAVFDTGANQKKVRIRGVSGSSESEPNETVGVYLDDISITNPGGTSNENNSSPDLNLYDINRIEVLKGPQGTLYGAGSMGGTIRFITNAPDLHKFSGEVQGRTSFTHAGSPSYGGDAFVNIPIVDDKLALRTTGSYQRDGGYIDNVAPAIPGAQVGATKKNFNSDRSWIIRNSLLYRPSDVVDFTLKYIHRQANVNGSSAVPRGQTLTANYGFLPSSTSNLDIVNGVADVHLGFGNVTSSTTYLDRRDLGVRDVTAFSQVLVPGGPAFGLYNANHYHEFSQEVRLASKGSSRLKYVVGLYYSNMKKQFIQDAPWTGLLAYEQVNGELPITDGKDPVTSPLTGAFDYEFTEQAINQSMRQVAVFGEATYSFTSKFDATLGARYSQINQKYLYVGDPNSLFSTPDALFRAAKLSEHTFNPKATLSYKVAPDVLLYTTAAKGFRPGGFNQPVPANDQCLADFARLGFNPNSIPGFKSDHLWSYEGGVKSQFADHRITVNASGYQINWSDIQLRNPLTCGYTVFGNAAKARIRGAEFAVSVRPFKGLTLSANGAYTDAKLLSASVTTGAAAGQALLGVPRYTLGGSAEYDLQVAESLHGYVRADGNYVSHYNSYFDPTENRVLGGFALLNVTLGVDADDNSWGAQIFIKNALNKYARTGAQNDVFGDLIYHNRPREMGIQLRHRF